MHRQECFAKLPAHSLSDCPVSDLLASQVLSVPVYAELRQEQLDEVIAALQAFTG
jgi:dTDP-4-amino-4,6-dideoxygalactose transaminase